jgi:hypothetical protein
MPQAAELTAVESRDVAPTITPSPVMDMIRQAVAAGQPLDVIRELKAMAKELADEEADRAFKAAFAAFKGEVITVVRNRKVTDGPLKGRRYAELVSFVEAATPALSRNGLSASWSVTRDDKDWIEVTCTIEHSLGGRKQVSLGGPPDAGGAKNPLQARISTVTYLERATFKAACGLAEQGDDDDGRAAGGVPATITDAQREELQDLIDKTDTDIERFCETFKIAAVGEMPAKDFDAAKRSMHVKLAKKLSGGQ